MKYHSTRDSSHLSSFTDIVLTGLAPDGGLYVPTEWPQFDEGKLKTLTGKSYSEIAFTIISQFVGDSIDSKALDELVSRTYGLENFKHSATAPLSQIRSNLWLLELYHGPTLSFKDYALQLLGNIFDYILKQSNKRLTIVGATSGDTGSAAIEACRKSQFIDIFILHPENRTSVVQRKQMTTVTSKNVHNIAVQGTFDDCQSIVKSLFSDVELRRQLNLSAINSINWARVMAQIVYYFYSSLSLGVSDRSISYTVPTGNFGNIFAAWAAKQMGLPINKLVIASNRNDILTRFFESGHMELDEVVPTISPSMDIQISSNFERYLYYLYNKDSEKVASKMQGLNNQNIYEVSGDFLQKARETFIAYRCSDNKTLEIMKQVYEQTDRLIDPHTAVGMNAAFKESEDTNDPHILVSTAHPAKFSDAVQSAVGVEPSLPSYLQEIMKKEEHYSTLPCDINMIKKYVLDNVSR
jgi:threonine synthase